MYYSHWDRDDRHLQGPRYCPARRSASPEHGSHPSGRKPQFDDKDHGRVQFDSEQNTFSSSPSPSHKKTRTEGYETLPLRPKIRATPPPLSADAARLLGIMKENRGQEIPQWMTSSVPERKEGGKLPSDDMRREDRNQAGSERQYGQQKNAAATSRGRRVGVIPAVSSEFGLPFKISAKKIRTRCLPSAIEVSERGFDSAYYMKTPIIIREADVSMSNLEVTTPKTATSGRAANAKYGFKLSQQAPTTRLAQPPVGVSSVFSSIATSVPAMERQLEEGTSTHDKLSLQHDRSQEMVVQTREKNNDMEDAPSKANTPTNLSTSPMHAMTEVGANDVTSDGAVQETTKPHGPEKRNTIRARIHQAKKRREAKAAAEAAESPSQPSDILSIQRDGTETTDQV